MASWSVTRSANGHVFGLYHGRLKARALETFSRALALDSVVTLTEHRVEGPRNVLDRKGPFLWGDGRCPCECTVHGKTACGCPCPRHPYTTGMK